MVNASKIILFVLFLSVAGCGGKQDPVVVVRTETKRETPPVEWLVVGPKPAKNYRTTGELYQYSEKMEASWDVLAETIRKIKAWAEKATSVDSVPDQK